MKAGITMMGHTGNLLVNDECNHRNDYVQDRISPSVHLVVISFYMRNKPVFFFGYFIAAGVVILLLSEVTVRIFGLAPPIEASAGNMVPDPYLPFLPRPNSRLEGRSRFDEFDYLIEINSVGFRDRDRPYQKPEGVFRILGLGDSTTYGGGALLEETYLARVEAQLNNRDGKHPQIDIIKAGVPRFYPEANRLLLQHYGLEYDPDVIIVGFGSSDVIDTLIGLDPIRISADGNATRNVRDSLSETGMLLYQYSQLARVLLSRYLSRKNARPVDWNEIYRDKGKYEAQWLAVEQEFARMAEMSRGTGADLVILYIPDFTLFERGEERDYPPQRLQQWARQNNAWFVDPTAAMLAAYEDSQTPLFWPRDRHPTPAGYQVIADVLYASLVSNNLVP